MTYFATLFFIVFIFLSFHLSTFLLSTFLSLSFQQKPHSGHCSIPGNPRGCALLLAEAHLGFINQRLENLIPSKQQNVGILLHNTIRTLKKKSEIKIS